MLQATTSRAVVVGKQSYQVQQNLKAVESKELKFTIGHPDGSHCEPLASYLITPWPLFSDEEHRNHLIDLALKKFAALVRKKRAFLLILHLLSPKKNLAGNSMRLKSNRLALSKLGKNSSPRDNRGYEKCAPLKD